MNQYRKQVRDERRKGIVAAIGADDLDWMFRDTEIDRSTLSPMMADKKRELLLRDDIWSDAEEAIFSWLDGARD